MKELSNIKRFTIGSHVYAVETLNVEEAINFANKVVRTFGPLIMGGAASLFSESSFDDSQAIGIISQGLRQLDEKTFNEIMFFALDRTITPDNSYLRDIAVRNAWFTQYPEELFMVICYAVFHLVADFFPKTLLTKASNLISQKQNVPAEAPTGQAQPEPSQSQEKV